MKKRNSVFGNESAYQRLDRRIAPTCRRQCLADFRNRNHGIVPEIFHHSPLRFGKIDLIFHFLTSLITDYSCNLDYGLQQ